MRRLTSTAAHGVLYAVLLAAALIQPPIADAQDLNWSTDVGAVGYAGDSSFDSSTGAYHIKGAGVGLTGSADAFHFAYYEVVRGDGQMVVRVSSADAQAQVALVIRESLDANAASAAAVVQNGSAQLVRRPLTGNNSAASGSAAVSVPCWLKLVRSGNLVSTLVSADGQVWTSLDSGTVTLGSSTVYAGFAVSNGAPGATGTVMASFDSIQSTFLPNEGLALWLKADVGVTQDASGRVSVWADQSGNGMDASQSTAGNQPQAVAAAMNGQPVVRFDGSNGYLQLPAGFADFTQGATALIVTRPSVANSWQRFFELANGPSVDSIVFCRHADSDQLLFECVNGNGNLVAEVASANGTLALNTSQLFEFSQNGTGGTATLYKNGQALTAQSAGAIANTTRANNFIARSNFNNASFAGDIAEIVLFNRPLSDSQRQSWENYLNAKYAYAAPPPTPTQLAATELSATQIALTWGEDPGATVTGYQLERQNTDGTWSVIAVLGPGTLSYIDNAVTAGVTFRYRVSALNGYGPSAPSSVTGFMTDPNTGQATFPTAGMQFWLRADLGVTTDANGGVSTWTDQAGGNHTASQGNTGSRPTLIPGDLNGQPALRFDGNNGHFDTDFVGMGGQGLTFFVVTKGTNYQSLVRLQNGNGYLVYPWGNHCFIDDRDGGTGNGVDSGLVSGQWNLAAVTYQSTGQMAAYRNGSLVVSRPANGQGLADGMPLMLGSIGNSELAAADLAEVLIYNRALSDTERQAVEAYLNSKYAVIAPPGAPSNLAGSAISMSQAGLFWRLATTGGSATGFAVERKPADGSSGYEEVAAIAGNQISSYIDEGLMAGASYVYRVRAYDDAGYSGYSSEATVTIPAAGPLPSSLPAIDALGLWLRPEVGVTKDTNNLVSVWTDASGLGNDAAQANLASQPSWVDNVINGHPALRFDGNHDSLATPQPVITTNHDATILAVVRLPDASDHGPFVKNGLYAGFALGVGSGTLDGNGNDALGLYDYVRWLNSGAQWGVGPVLAEMTVDGSGNPAMYRNGALLGNLGTGGPAASTGPTFIGGYSYDTARFFRGDIAEVVIFNRVLTDAQRQAWESYLNTKYNYDPVPTPPTQLVATPLSGTQAALNWVDTFGNIGGYTVEEQNADGTWSVITTLPAGATRYTVTNLVPGTAYQFRVTATNHTGNSPAATIALTIPASFQALPAGDARLWLRADTGTVTDSNGLLSQWMDASGNGLSASQGGGNRPTVVANALNGLPAIHFDGGSSFLNLPGNLTSNLSGAEVYVVLRAADPLANAQRGLWRFDDGGIAEYPWSDGDLYETFGTNGQCAYNPGGAALDQFNLYNVSAAATGQWSARLNGEVLRSYAGNTVRFSAGQYTLGRDRDGRLFAGDIAEVIIFDRALTDTERQGVEQYLAAKYALASSPGAPTNLAARALSPTQVSLTWQYPVGSSAMRFGIQRQGAGDNGFQTVANVENATSLIDNTAVAGVAYTYQVVATDLAGNLSAASNQTQIVTPAAGTALPTNGLRLWLKADAGTTATIDDWQDQSGNGNDAQQGNAGNQTTVVPNVLNGRPVVHFDGNSSFLQFPGSFADNLSQAEVFVVLRAADPLTNNRGLWRMSDSDDEYYPLGNGELYENFGSGTRYGPVASPVPLDQFNLYNVSAAANGNYTMRMNEQVLFTTVGNPLRFSAGAYLLGQTRNGQRFAGDIAEVLIFDHALGDGDRLVVEEYLAGKYALAAAPATPAALGARALSPTQVSLTWQYPPAGSATQFTVERAISGTDQYQVIGVVNNGTSFIDSTAAAGTAYQYRIVATDLAGDVSAASDAAAVTTLAGGAALPTSGLRLWLRADAGASGTALNSWLDQSGNGNNAQQTVAGYQPTVVPETLNGQPVIRFNGSQYLQFAGNPLDGASAGEVFVVLKAADPLTNNCGLWRLNDSNNSFYPLGNGAIYENFGTDGQYGPIFVPSPLDQFNLYNVSAAPNAWTMRMNEQMLFTTANNSVRFSAGAYLLGQTRDGYPFHGDLAEILVFDHALNVTDRLAVEQYLAGKYALVSAPPAPTGLGLRVLSPTQVSLTWQYPPSNDATQFTVERAIAGSNDYQVIAVVNGGTSFIDVTAVAGTDYTYRVVATDLAGDSSAASSAVAASTPASGPVFPTVGLRVWLKADAGTTGGALPAWLDQSGNGNHAQQNNAGNQPAVMTNVLNGQPVVHFAGGQYLQFPGNVFDNLGGAEVFAVLRAADPLTNNCGLWRLSDSNNEFYPLGNGAIYENFGSNTQYGPVAPSASLDQFNLYNVSAAASGQYTLRMNEQVLFTTVGNPLRFSAGAYLLGQTRDGYTFQGDLAEVLIFDHALGDGDRLAVEQYLAGKYALTTAPPAPTNLSAHALSGTQVSLNWQYPETNDASVFTVERALAGTSDYTVVATLDDGTSWVDATVSPGTSYSYQVMATDLAGNVSAASAAVTVGTPVGGVTMPMTGLRLWLKADAGTTGSVLASWLDQSGNGNHAQQGVASIQPQVIANALNGQPVIRFNGHNWLFFPGSVFDGVTEAEVFIVLRAADPLTNNCGLWRFSDSNNEFYPLGNGAIYENFGSNTQYGPLLPSTSSPLDQFNLYSVSAAADGTYAVHFNQRDLLNVPNNPLRFSAGAYLLGQTRDGYAFQGDIAEVLVFDHALSPEDHNRVAWYLAAKYLLADFDLTGDGMTTGQKLALGLDPFALDSNGDGLSDATALQLGLNPAAGGGFIYTTPPNPTGGNGGGAPPADPNDHTPPIITLTAPANAVPVP